MNPDQAYGVAFPIVWRLENGGDAIVATNTPGDSGGYTRGGVALNRHPELTRVQLDEMTYSDFAAFYRREYWSPNGCDNDLKHSTNGHSEECPFLFVAST